jgi:hypothetical protein
MAKQQFWKSFYVYQLASIQFQFQYGLATSLSDLVIDGLAIGLRSSRHVFAGAD